MNAHRTTAVLVGILFIVGTVSGILAGVLTAPIQASPTFPLNISANETPWIIGTVFILLMGLSLAMIPALLYPILKKHNQVLALGYVLFRGAFETVGTMVMVISFFLLLTVSEMHGKAGAADAASLHAMGSVLHATADWTEMTAGAIFSVGTLMVFALFYETRLIPRWLSGWAMIGAVLYLIANIVSMFSPLHLAPEAGAGIGMLLMPTAIQEMVFALWLIVKGFNAPAVAALSAPGTARLMQSAS